MLIENPGLCLPLEQKYKFASLLKLLLQRHRLQCHFILIHSPSLPDRVSPYPHLTQISFPTPMSVHSYHKARQEPETCVCGGPTSTVFAPTTVVSLPSIPNNVQLAPPAELIWEMLNTLAAIVPVRYAHTLGNFTRHLKSTSRRDGTSTMG